MSIAIDRLTEAEPGPTGPSAWFVERAWSFPAMGGQVRLRVAAPAGHEREADQDLRRVAGHIERWAGRITRFDPASELSRLDHASDEPATSVGPSLAAVLARARELTDLTDGLVDITLLDARLAAERGASVTPARGDWRLLRSGRGGRVLRDGRVRFDLDGVGKGWIADRALARLARYPAALVDADGDIALRVAGGSDWGVAIADPRHGGDLATIAVPTAREATALGMATSGTTVHRWEQGSGWAHHLIDPRTGESADTDVVQATVVAEGALVAEALAKAVVIAGSVDGVRLLEGAGAMAALILLESGQLMATKGSEEWLV